MLQLLQPKSEIQFSLMIENWIFIQFSIDKKLLKIQYLPHLRSIILEITSIKFYSLRAFQRMQRVCTKSLKKLVLIFHWIFHEKTHSIFNSFYMCCKLKHYTQKITFMYQYSSRVWFLNNIKCARGCNGLGDLNVIDKQTKQTNKQTNDLR